MARTSHLVSYGLIAAAVGLAVVAVVDRDRPTTKEQTARAGLLLRVFRPDEITRITVERRTPGGGVEKLELVREGDSWKMTSPRIARADFLAVTGFINALQGARAERALGKVQGGERAQLGLDAPRAKVEIAMKGVTLNLALGAPATGGGATDGGAAAAYLEIAPYGDEKGGVYVVTPDVAAVLDRDANAYREPSLLAGNQSPTFTRIAVRGMRGDVTFERAPNGSWRLADGKRANADAVDGLLLALYELKASPFVADATPIDTSKGGTVEITQSSGNKLNVSLGGPCPVDPKLVVAKSEGGVACVPAVTAERVVAPASLYTDERAFWLQPGTESAKTSEIEAIVVEEGGQKLLDAERRGDGLHLRVPHDEQIDREPTDRYLARVAAIAGPIVTPDLAAVGLSPPTGRVILRRRVSAAMVGASAGDAGSVVSEQIVEIGKPLLDKRVIHLRRVDDGAVLEVPLEVAQPLRAAAVHDLRSPNLLSLTADAIKRVRVRPSEGVSFELSRNGSFWELPEPKGFGADPAGAGAIASTLATLLCTRWAAEKDDGSFGFDKPSVVVDVEREVTGDAGDANVTVELGRESSDASGGVYARVRGRDPVCVLPIGKRDALLKPPVDARAVGFDPTVTPRIVAARGGRKRAIQYSDVTKSWTDASDAGGGAELLARKLADAVRGLRAEGLVHLGAARPDEGFDAPVLVLEGYEGAAVKKKLVVGGVGKLGDLPVHYVRVDGVDATWAVLRSDVDAITSLL